MVQSCHAFLVKPALDAAFRVMMPETEAGFVGGCV
jgi:hypothetical protein